MFSKFVISLALTVTAVAAFGLHPTQDRTVLASKAGASHQAGLHWEPQHLTNGSAFLFVVRQPASIKSLQGTWLEHTVYFDWDAARKAWVGLAGIGIETPPGIYTLVLTGVSSKGNPLSFDQSVRVGHKSYPSIELNVPERYVSPDPETVIRIEKEKELKTKVFAAAVLVRQWSGSFVEPIASTPSGGFGKQRKFNGVVKSVHQGLDFQAKMGTSVGVVSSGTVALARDLFYEGQCVMVDHGQGLLTIYMHLSEIKVREGDKVTQGQLIGLSGSSGRATGPHLHLGVRWQGVYLDPRTLFGLKLPALPSQTKVR